MVKNKLFLLLFIFLLTACQDQDIYSKNLDIISNGKKHSFEVEVVTTPEEQAKGLMHRESLPENAGMLFWFGGQEEERGFWMKNTLIPLDMIFIKRDGTIHRIHQNARPLDLNSVRSYGPVAAVLEINGGMSEKLGLNKGDRVKHTVFRLK
jgi:hypothetical protein